MDKLKLEYVWIDKYKCFENEEFNLSTKYKFHYDKQKNELVVSENKNYIENFFGKNIDVTTIVGTNGSGKTTILSFIMESFNHSTKSDAKGMLLFSNGAILTKLDSKGILEFSNEVVWKKSDSIKSYYFTESEDSVKLMDLYSKQNSSVLCMYYSQAIDWAQYRNINKYIINLSNGKLLGELNIKQINSYFFTKEFYKQMKFINEFKNHEEIIGFKLPKYVIVDPVYYDTDEIINKTTEYYVSYLNQNQKKKVNQLIKKTKFYNESGEPYKDDIKSYFGELIKKFTIYKKNEDTGNKYKALLKDLISITFFGCLCKKVGEGNESKISYEDFIKYLVESSLENKFEGADSLTKIGILFKKIKDNIVDIHNKFTAEIQTLISFYDKFSKLIEEKTFINVAGNSFRALLNDNNTNDNKIEEISFQELCYEYQTVYDIFNFSWDLSSGEISRLTLYSRLYNEVKTNELLIKSNELQDEEKSVLLLIDEADMLLHPEWQRTFVSNITNVLPEVFQNRYVQVIIATHSPIILSDIPKQNVIYLYKNQNGEITVDKNAEHSETFGANIYKLFNDAFFLKEGSIGEFAEEKIKELLNLIDNSADQEKEKIKSMINIIGDQFLKSKIERMFYERLNNRTNNESRLMELEEKKNNIQKEIDNIKRNIKND